MPIPHDLLKTISPGYSIACELPCSETGMREFVEVLCRTVPGPSPLGERVRVPGFEVRYLKHHEKYTLADFGNDWHLALADESTVVKRTLVEGAENLAHALAPWEDRPERWMSSIIFESALVGGPITRSLEGAEK